MSKKIIEAEIIEEPKGFKYKERYTKYTQDSKNYPSFVTYINLLSIVFSFIPVFGFIFAWFAFAINIFKKIPPIIPVIALIISGFISATFTLIVWVFRLIF